MTLNPEARAMTLNPEARADLEKLLGLLIADAAAEGASDVHLNASPLGWRLRYRVDGALRNVHELPASIRDAMPTALADLVGGRIVGQLRTHDHDVRFSCVSSVQGPNLVLRLLEANRVPLALDELGMDADTLGRWRALLKHPYGLLIISGPTGSGKTTTAYASLAEIATPERNVITVEDPVECIFDWAVQLPMAGTFPDTLRSVYAQDPDVLYCGEVRDGETAETLARMALSGHQVLTCLHAPEPALALQRLEAAGLAPALLHSAVSGVLCQRLVRLLCPSCRRLDKGEACEACHGTGHHGRRGVFTLWTPDHADVSLKDAALELARRGEISHEEALRG